MGWDMELEERDQPRGHRQCIQEQPQGKYRCGKFSDCLLFFFFQRSREQDHEPGWGGGGVGALRTEGMNYNLLGGRES